jgi:hypothetical protein
MEDYRRSLQEGKTVFVGVDVPCFSWHVTVRTEDQRSALVGIYRATGTFYDGYWIGIGAIRFVWYMRWVIVGFGFMIDWWHMERVVLSPHRASCLRSMVIGLRRTGKTAVSWRIFCPRGCSSVFGYQVCRSVIIGGLCGGGDNS